MQPPLRSACAAEVCRGLGVLVAIEIVQGDRACSKINFVLGSDCQSDIHKFSTRQKIMSFNSRISEVVREFLRIRNKCMNNLVTEKIAAHQDEVKRADQLSFMERINIQCDAEAKEWIQK